MITLAPYNPAWSQLFAAEKATLKQAWGDIVLEIAHIGSTAIPGIYAKPVIDILVGVRDLNQFTHEHIKIIESLGYHYIPAYEEQLPYRRFFQKDDKNGQRSHQIHLVNCRSSWYQRHILFRDYLRKYPADAKAYEAHKLKLAAQYNDSNQYATAKNEFCRAIDKKAFFDFTINRPFIKTQRLQAFIPQLACFDAYRDMMQDKDFIACFGIACNQERIYQVLVEDMAHWDQHGFGAWMWYDNEHQFIGRAGLKSKVIENNHEVELAYAIIPDVWGRGFAIEMGAAAIDFAFNTIHLSNLICFTTTTNQQSLRVMEKLGFQYEKDFIYYELPVKLHRLQNPKIVF